LEIIIIFTIDVHQPLPFNLPSIGRRHDEVLEVFADYIRKAGHAIQINQAFRDSSFRPDIVVSSTKSPIIIDLTIPFDAVFADAHHCGR
jgi:hypothetical protein